MSRHNIVVAVLVLCFAALLPFTAHAQTAMLRPEQPTVEVGQAIIFVGSGFGADERVATWATAPDGAVVGGEYATAKNGNLRVPFFVPRNALAGRWAFTAYGETSKTLAITAFEVVGGRAAEEALATVQPPSAPAGSTFFFAATGYDEREQVSYWLTAPDGTVADAYPAGDRADEDGLVEVRWQAPPDAPTGTWAMTIQGLRSGVARAIRFEVR